MKRLLYTILFLLVGIVFNASEIKAKETVHAERVKYAASDIFNLPADWEDRQQTFRTLYPAIQKSPSAGRSVDDDAGSIRKSEISTYVFYAEYHIPRFEGADIIYPFNCFW